MLSVTRRSVPPDYLSARRRFGAVRQYSMPYQEQAGAGIRKWAGRPVQCLMGTINCMSLFVKIVPSPILREKPVSREMGDWLRETADPCLRKPLSWTLR